MQTNVGHAADSVDEVAQRHRVSLLAGGNHVAIFQPTDLRMVRPRLQMDSRRTLLISMVQSAFEEMEERHKLLNVQRIREKAEEEAMVRRRSSKQRRVESAFPFVGQDTLSVYQLAQALLAQKNKQTKTAAERSTERLQVAIEEHRKRVMARASGGRPLRRHVGQTERQRASWVEPM
eukprot:scaffold7881_cov258-Pinguiococcus_pyrenoidosus.AAC.3